MSQHVKFQLLNPSFVPQLDHRYSSQYLEIDEQGNWPITWLRLTNEGRERPISVNVGHVHFHGAFGVFCLLEQTNTLKNNQHVHV